MNFLKKIKKIFKNTSNIVINELELNKEYNQLKLQIINNQDLKELKNICDYFNLDVTLKEFYTQNIQENIHLEQLIEYCEINKIEIKKYKKLKKQIDKKYNINKLKYKPKLNVKIKLE